MTSSRASHGPRELTDAEHRATRGARRRSAPAAAKRRRSRRSRAADERPPAHASGASSARGAGRAGAAARLARAGGPAPAPAAAPSRSVPPAAPREPPRRRRRRRARARSSSTRSPTTCPGRTASGLPVGVGVIAVDPAVIPLGTRVFVPGYGVGRRGRRRVGDQEAASSTSGCRAPLRRGPGGGAPSRSPSTVRARATPARALSRSRSRRWRSRSPLAAPATSPARLTKTLRSPSLLARPHVRDRRRRWTRARCCSAHNAARPVIPASNEKLPVVVGRARPASAPTTASRRRCSASARAGATWDGDLVPPRGRRPDPHVGRPRGPRRRSCVPAGSGGSTGRIRGDESAFDKRRGARRLEAVLRRDRDTAALGARRRPGAQGWPKRCHHRSSRRARFATHSSRARGLRRAAHPSGSAPRRRDAVPSQRDSLRHARGDRAEDEPDSDNFTAEMLLKHLGTLDGRVGTSARGVGDRARARCRRPGSRPRASGSSTARVSPRSTA